MAKEKNVSAIENYLRAVRKANNEEVKRQQFVLLLERIFGSGEDARSIIDQIVAGAEKAITDIVREGKVSDRGRADSQYQNIIIEFEQDLKKTGEHAKDQLAEYLSGNWNSGNAYHFTLIASDCLEWRIYAPNLDTISKTDIISADDVVLEEVESFTLSEGNAEDFYYFIDAYLFRHDKQKATLHSIQKNFGQTSNAFITCYQALEKYFNQVKETGEVKVAYEQWQRFLSIAYDRFDGGERIFLIHTYLSVFSKMLTYEVITHDDYIDDNELKGIVTGTIFDQLNIKNFTDNDFFHWVGSEDALKQLKTGLRAISSELDGFDFNDIAEDILKGVYQELIDRDTRQSLGEYYTPDWLCESIVQHLDIQKNSRMLDPSCGSGSFLRVVIDRLKREHPELTADELAERVCGVDIHPLSVLISKATVLIALGEKIHKAPRPVNLSVFLADTLSTPTGTVNLDLLGDEYIMWIDKKKISINTRMFDSPALFDSSIHAAEKIAHMTLDSATMPFEQFKKTLNNHLTTALDEYYVNSIYEIYKALKEAKEEGRDSIWEFIILNLYRPCFFHRSFDFVVGNPPWFTYKSIQNSIYQERLKHLAIATDVWPKKATNNTHLEIAAIFLSHCCGYFLKDEGRLAFVLPRSFFAADHHDNTRAGKAKGVRINEIWDLEDVKPLFNVPSCVFFAERAKANINKAIPKSGRKGKSYSGNLPSDNANLQEASKHLSVEDRKYFYSKLGASSAFTNKQMKDQTASNYYKKLFYQGATLLPRNFYFVNSTQHTDGELKNRTISVETSKETNSQAKEPWKDILLTGRIHTDFLFRTALAQNILPFVLYEPPLVLLPLKKGKADDIHLLSSDQIIQEGRLDTAQWFQEVEKYWNDRKSEKSHKMTSLGRLDFQRLLSSQKLNHRYVVLYSSSAKDANSVVLDRNSLDRDFIADHKAYVYFTHDIEEASFLAAFLNSGYANKKIKDFQNKGLFGPRDIHKKILDVPLPKFNKSNPDHCKLAELGKLCTEKASTFLQQEGTYGKLSAHHLGRVRSSIRKHLDPELKQIDSLLKRL